MGFSVKVSDTYTKAETGSRRKILSLIDDSQATISIKLWNSDIERVELPLPNTKITATNFMVNLWEGKNELNARNSTIISVRYYELN